MLFRIGSEAAAAAAAAAAAKGRPTCVPRGLKDDGTLTVHIYSDPGAGPPTALKRTALRDRVMIKSREYEPARQPRSTFVDTSKSSRVPGGVKVAHEKVRDSRDRGTSSRFSRRGIPARVNPGTGAVPRHVVPFNAVRTETLSINLP